MAYIRKASLEPPADGCSASDDPLRQAAELFRRYYCFPPSRVIRTPFRRTVPPVLVHLGFLRGLIYSSDRGNRGCPKNYIHFLDSPPVLASNPAGTQLYIVGGCYRVTRRGIEG